MRGRRLTVVRALVAASALVLFWVLGTHVSAPTVAGADRTDCGSLPTVLRVGAGPHVGELRADQAAFDSRCVARAELRAWAGGAAGLVLVGGWVVLAAEARRVSRGPGPGAETYVVPRLP